MKFVLGFFAGFALAVGSIAAVGYAQTGFPDPFAQQNQQWNQNQLEFNAQSYSTMRDGGIGYQKSYVPRNPC
jgi:hypothetical protein